MLILNEIMSASISPPETDTTFYELDRNTFSTKPEQRQGKFYIGQIIQVT